MMIGDEYKNCTKEPNEKSCAAVFCFNDIVPVIMVV